MVSFTGSFEPEITMSASRISSRDPFASSRGAFDARVSQQHHELLSSEATDEILTAECLLEKSSHCLQHFVAREVAVAVVDVPKKVEVAHENRERPARAGVISRFPRSTVP